MELEFRRTKGLPVFFFKLFLKFLIFSNLICEKFLIHDNNFYVLALCLCVIPTLAYFIKFYIPKRYTLYSNATIEQLGRYEYQLSRLKYKYEKLTKNLNELAFKSKD